MRLVPALLSMLLLVSCTTRAALSPQELAVEYHVIANAWAELKDYPRAVEFYLRALERDPGQTAAAYNHARALAVLGSFKEAEALFLRLAEIEPDNSLVREGLAYVRFKLGKTTEALVLYESLERTAGDRISVLLSLGRILRASQPERARMYLERALAIEPDNASIIEDLAALYGAAGELSLAVSMYDRYRKQGGLDGKVLAAAAAVYEAASYYATAAALYRDLWKREAGTAEHGLNLARILYTQAFDIPAAATVLKDLLDSGFADAKALSALLDAMSDETRPAALAAIKEKLPGFAWNQGQ